MNRTLHPPKSTDLTHTEVFAGRSLRLVELSDGVFRWRINFNDAGEQLFCGASCAPPPNLHFK